jgi:hypothetical protein
VRVHHHDEVAVGSGDDQLATGIPFTATVIQTLIARINPNDVRNVDYIAANIGQYVRQWIRAQHQ